MIDAKLMLYCSLTKSFEKLFLGNSVCKEMNLSDVATLSGYRPVPSAVISPLNHKRLLGTVHLDQLVDTFV